jgi:predicted amidohydrolase
MTNRFRVGILQFSGEKDKDENLRRIKEILQKSKVDSDILVIPEYSMADITGMAPETVYRISEDIDGPWINEFKRLSRTYNTCIVANLFERSPSKPKVYNTVVFIRDGEIIGKYRKIHLFDAYGYRESDYMLSGDSPMEPIEISGLNVAAAICFDIRFPELFRYYALKDVDMIVLPAAWYRGPMKEETLRTLAAARSHENNIYMVLAVQYNENFIGRSMVVDPYGNVMYDAGIGEKYVEIDIDPGLLDEARRKIPILKLLNKNLYSILCRIQD